MKGRQLKKIFLIISGLTLYSGSTYCYGKYDISKDRILYTVGYSHLDTEWLWDYPEIIDEYLPNTMDENFYLFEKYPEYSFNFTGSRRYKMMKEYYPEKFEILRKYVKQGRWHVAGSSVDEGEVNISSSESLIRQILYGNLFFKKEFNTESKDYMLPDCFGFTANVPTVLNHCGLLGFSTQKLSWKSAAGIPFNVGIWKGPDGKGVIAALNATSYNGRIPENFERDSLWNARISDNTKKYGFSFDYRYYGVGDKGGAPRENDVRNAVESLHDNHGKFKLVLGSSDQMFKDITPAIKNKLPEYYGDLLLIEHSAGSLTSQSYMKRLNRKNELLAKSAEMAASAADWIGNAEYPFERLNNSWELLLGSQFHDILPGTSIPKAYEYAWNDEFIAANGFAGVMNSAVNVIAEKLDTRARGKSVIVYNPVASNREDIASINLNYSTIPESIDVLDKDGKEVPSQIIGRKGNTISIIFLAKMPSAGFSIFEIIPRTSYKTIQKSKLKVTENSLENEYYNVKVSDNGDIKSIYDKLAEKELLSKPAGLDFQQECPSEWPAWNMDWKDRQKAPIAHMDKNVSIKIIENGPVRVSIEVKRENLNSKIAQVYSLSAGECGKHLEITNKIDWQSKEVSLKAAFPLNVANENATYNIGTGTMQRCTNNEKKFEVPSKEWFDLTDISGKYGVTILEDCKYGSDKPDNNTLRLTLLYTPRANNKYRFQSSQDWGIHYVRYGIYGHNGDWAQGRSQIQGMFFNEPLIAFETSKHKGELGRSFSIVRLNSNSAGIMAFKKMEDGDYYIVRLNELSGKNHNNIVMSFPYKIKDAYEVNGQEQKTGSVSFSGKNIEFDLSHYSIKSFAVKFDRQKGNGIPLQKAVPLPYDEDVFSFDHNRSDGNFDGYSLPAELIPQTIKCDNIYFKMGSTKDTENNVVKCDGQKIMLPEGNFDKLYILAAADKDTTCIISFDGHDIPVNIENATGFIGQFYNREFASDKYTVTKIDEPFVKQSEIAWFSSHLHNGYPSKNESYKYCYIFKYEINIPKGVKNFKLPQNPHIKIFAASVANVSNNTIPLQPIYDNLKNDPIEFRK